MEQDGEDPHDDDAEGASEPRVILHTSRLRDRGEGAFSRWRILPIDRGPEELERHIREFSSTTVNSNKGSRVEPGFHFALTIE